jgi:hypothetical protein
MINIRNIITQAYVQSQLISAEFNDELDGVRAETAVQQLNQIVAQLNTAQLFPFTRKSYLYPVIASQNSYSIGIDHDNTIPLVADIQTEKPDYIERIYYKSIANASPIDIMQCDFGDLQGRMFSPTAMGLPNWYAMDTH